MGFGRRHTQLPLRDLAQAEGAIPRRYSTGNRSQVTGYLLGGTGENSLTKNNAKYS